MQPFWVKYILIWDFRAQNVRANSIVFCVRDEAQSSKMKYNLRFFEITLSWAEYFWLFITLSRTVSNKVSQLSILEQRGNETDFLSIEEYVEIMKDLGKGREASKVKQ